MLPRQTKPALKVTTASLTWEMPFTMVCVTAPINITKSSFKKS